MPRINPVNRDAADAATGRLLDAVQKKPGNRSQPDRHNGELARRGRTPTSVSARRFPRGRCRPACGNSSPWSLAKPTTASIASPRTRRSAKGAGLSEGETCDARRAVAADDKERAALEFARTIVTDRGNVSDDDVQAVRQAGYNRR